MNGIHPCQWIAIAACIAVADSSFGGDVPVMIRADLRNPLLVITGSPNCQRSQTQIEFSRFPDELLEMDEAELCFKPEMARTLSGSALD